MKNQKVLSINEYIAGVASSKTEFANNHGLFKQQITKWVKNGYVVIDGVMHKPMRDFKSKGAK